MARIGLQLYSVREACDADLPGVLARVREMGAEGVEFALRHGRTPGEVRRMLSAEGLECPCGHTSLDALEGDLAREEAWARTIGFDTLIVGWVHPPQTGEQARLIARRVALAADRVAACGLRLAWHNHEFEFARLDDGTRLWDVLDALRPSLAFEFDYGWLWQAGEDPGAWARARSKGTRAAHIKDLASRGGRDFRRLGRGGVGYAGFVRDIASDWLIVEQDEPDGPDAMTCAVENFAALRGMLR
ncbi:MAG: sugar phosphate isomerase/epimerase [Phycisphaerales bacterium]|nr:sugar phosphate isomerase/epimerase [Phycisphaerales bacterium]